VTTNSGGVSGSTQVTTSGPALPPGAIVGIVLGVILIFLVGIVIAVRKQSLNKRLKLRGWATTNRTASPSFLWIEPSEKSRLTPFTKSPRVQTSRDIPAAFGTAGNQYTSSSAGHIPPMPVPTFLAQPDYNADLPPTPLNTPPAIANQTPETAIVLSTFIPVLPDELSITTRETIRILSVYDDGWAYCANERGEAGMVPLECLARRGVPRGSERRSRNSSLAPSIQQVPRF
jgi:hypothetical protein